MKLSILIPTLVERKMLFERLMIELEKQIIYCNASNVVEIVFLLDNRELSIGAKRNKLMAMANGDYICYFDDDDLPESNYLSLILKAIEESPDVICFNGNYINKNVKIEWRLGLNLERKTIYNNLGQIERYEAPPNHIAVMRRELVSKYLFKDISFAEDSLWADEIKLNKVLKKEIKINEIIYNYVFTK